MTYYGWVKKIKLKYTFTSKSSWCKSSFSFSLLSSIWVQIYKKVQFRVNSCSWGELKLNKTCLYLFVFLYDGSMSLSLLFCLFNVLSPHLLNLQTTKKWLYNKQWLNVYDYRSNNYSDSRLKCMSIQTLKISLQVMHWKRGVIRSSPELPQLWTSLVDPLLQPVKWLYYLMPWTVPLLSLLTAQIKINTTNCTNRQSHRQYITFCAMRLVEDQTVDGWLFQRFKAVWGKSKRSYLRNGGVEGAAVLLSVSPHKWQRTNNQQCSFQYLH